MKTLQIIPSRNLVPKLTENAIFNCISGVRQVGFASPLSGKRKDWSFCVKTRSLGENGGGFMSGRRKSSQDKDQDERDTSGSVAGFHLVPHSGK